MAYPDGRKIIEFTSTGGNPFLSLNATTGLFRANGGPTTIRVRALAWVQTATNIKGGGVISVRLSSGAGSTATTTVVDTITTVTTGAAGTYGRGSVAFVDGLRTVVSAGSDLHARITTGASKVIGRLFAYVDVQPFDLLNNSRAVESA